MKTTAPSNHSPHQENKIKPPSINKLILGLLLILMPLSNAISGIAIIKESAGNELSFDGVWEKTTLKHQDYLMITSLNGEINISGKEQGPSFWTAKCIAHRDTLTCRGHGSSKNDSFVYESTISLKDEQLQEDWRVISSADGEFKDRRGRSDFKKVRAPIVDMQPQNATDAKVEPAR